MPWKPVTELTQAEFEAKLLDEARGFFLPAKAVMPSMIDRGRTASASTPWPRD